MKTMDKDEDMEYADELILKIKNQLEDYGQTLQRNGRKQSLLMELEVLQGV